MIIAAAMTAVFAKLIEPILDRVLVEGQTSLIVPMAFGVFVCFVVRGFATYAHTLIMNRAGQGIVAQIQQDLFSNFLNQELGFFQKIPSGELTARVVHDVYVVRGAVTEAFTGFGKSVLTLLFLAVVMFYQDWRLSLIAFIVFPPAAFFVAYIGKKMRKVSGSIQTEVAGLSSLLTQTFQGIRQVKAYGMEGYERAHIGEAITRLKKLVVKSFRISSMSTPFNESLVGLAVMGLIIYGGFQVTAGHLTTGELMSFITAFALAYEPIKKLAKLNNSVQLGLGAAERVFDMMDRQTLITDRPNAKRLEIVQPEICFDHIRFSYGGDNRYALDDISFTAPAGKVTALVGPSGSGKTTAMNLVPRFYDPDEGAVRLSGQDIRDFTIASLRKQIALVSQDVMIFDDTVAANIAYGREGARREEIVEAAKAAAADSFISDMPDGYDTRVGEHGSSLSGGQRQRVAIARAILRDAPILLLDEATSALDNESEKLIQESLERLQKDRTVIVIAHRLSTVKNADLIVVLDEGKAVESGRHKDLMEQNGVYARMYETGFQA